MVDKKDVVREILRNPQKICRSAVDEKIYLYYGAADRLYCAVAKHATAKEGFLVTAYPVDKIKEGEVIWTK